MQKCYMNDKKFIIYAMIWELSKPQFCSFVSPCVYRAWGASAGLPGLQDGEEDLGVHQVWEGEYGQSQDTTSRRGNILYKQIK